MTESLKVDTPETARQVNLRLPVEVDNMLTHAAHRLNLTKTEVFSLALVNFYRLLESNETGSFNDILIGIGSLQEAVQLLVQEVQSLESLTTAVLDTEATSLKGDRDFGDAT